ncbi:putative Autophagy-related protein 18d [Paratrimastix pyriformis]|uniref:Autophagy-related protein 18d n=1 Tax=Paratrimastix pyriformis TaxID=342808 RepID=A0ABQ8U8H3_9EUKA|nr:putative Autophagy-related protein 18d [Paratrimastix pyriformis]
MNLHLGQGDTGEITFLGFNQDQTRLAVGTRTGFRVFSTNNLMLSFLREFGAPISLVEMLFCTNVLAFVGSGPDPFFPSKVVIWEDSQGSLIGEVNFKSPVCGIRLRRDRLVVILERSIVVYALEQLRLLDKIATSPNPAGVCAVCPMSPKFRLACPGEQVGEVLVKLFDLDRTHHIQAHEHPITAMAMNIAGTRLATASEKGTLIRIFSVETGEKVLEVRRGKDPSNIDGLCFSSDSRWLAVSSTRVRQAGRFRNFRVFFTTHPCSDIILLSFLSPVIPYFGGSWSFAQFHIPGADRSPHPIRSICAFTPANELIVATSEGMFYKCRFQEGAPGPCQVLQESRFLDLLPADTPRTILAPASTMSAAQPTAPTPATPPPPPSGGAPSLPEGAAAVPVAMESPASTTSPATQPTR